MSEQDSNTGVSTPWDQDLDYEYIPSQPPVTESQYPYPVHSASPLYGNYNNTLQMYQSIPSTSGNACSYGNTMTSSTSCPSFTSLYFDPENASSTNVLETNIQNEWTAAMHYDMNTSIQNPSSYVTYPLTPSQSHVSGYCQGYTTCDTYPTRIQDPHEERLKRDTIPRSKIRASASFTCLSSMEKEDRRPYGKPSSFPCGSHSIPTSTASKRRKALEPCYRKGRQKSFDSTTTSTMTLMSRSTSTGCLSNPYETPDTYYMEDNINETDMIGYSIDDLDTQMHPTKKPDNLDAMMTSPDAEKQSPAMLSTDTNHQNEEISAINEVNSPMSALLQSIGLVDLQDEMESSLSMLTEEARTQVNAWEVDKSLHPKDTPSLTDRLACVLQGTPPKGFVFIHKSEESYFSESSLFSLERCACTAGSLWLLLHSSKCVSECDINGCSTMKRVIQHCVHCDISLGNCQVTCDEAKAILLHYGSCCSREEKSRCRVCSQLDDIQAAHQALKHKSAINLLSFAASAPETLSKHVPIQPNLQHQNATTPILGSFALYLEQTCPSFRVELQTRVEKRVTASASQNLFQHMQKKTRLRSLDAIRAEARLAVRAEMERELYLYMQTVSLASLGNGPQPLQPWLKKLDNFSFQNANGGGFFASVPSYLLHGSVSSSLASFFEQQPRNESSSKSADSA
uniref:Uncharacterized protein AlNc14C212G8937 n=1 Tax=Albugo laibachii Nc14 TaxID=890382 RepID=F0WRD2_9STRA|nr:conserved hypothetical protein [Albugo laibachii Nc14]|eukprot:CCA23895.1 conserved hypothetical protein [Albugo laibachii Nc14]